MTYRLALLAALVSLGTQSGCAKLMGNLRRDFDDRDREEYLSESEGDMSSDRDRPERASSAYSGAAADYDGPESGEGPNRYDSLGHVDKAQFPANQELVTSGNTPFLIPDKKRQYDQNESMGRVKREDFVNHSQEEGSLWASTGQTNYYLTKNRIRSQGDLISVNIESDLYKDIIAEVKKMLSPREKAMAIATVRDDLRRKFQAQQNKDTITTAAAAPERAPAVPGAPPNPATPANPAQQRQPAAAPSTQASEDILNEDDLLRKQQQVSLESINFQPLLGLKEGDTMMGEILTRYPNGNYKIRVTKRIAYQQWPARIVSVVGIVRPGDISEDADTVNSGKLYEYRIEVAH